MKIPTDFTPKTTAFRFDQGSAANGDFKKALLQARGGQASPVPAARPAAPATVAQQYTVRPGDNMFSIARRVLEARGADASDQAATRAATQLARSNGLANPDMILPGQVIQLSGLGNTQRSTANARTDTVASLAPPVLNKAAAAAPMQASVSAPANPIMEKMLDRAVNMQYIDPAEKDAVRNKLLSISSEYQFKPDDLATVMLMESDGMNPRANNGRCYGVIQFCDGPNRGAASVGYAENPRGILKLGVLDQLDLVRKYFDETGLKKMAPAALDDLYLTVLKPASRAERDPAANLQIPGNQAAVLYPGNDRSQPITRQSLLAGLQQNARGKLALDGPRSVPPVRVAALAPGAGASLSRVSYTDLVSRAYEDGAVAGRTDHEL